MFKRLDPQDIIVGHGSIIEPIGTGSGGLAVYEDDYNIYTCNKNGGALGDKQRYRQLANIIQGDSESDLPIGTGPFNVAIFNRNNFKESLHPSSFSYQGGRPLTGSNQVNYCEAGRVYESDGYPYWLYPDIGLFLVDANPYTDVYACSEQIITTSQIFIRARNSEFNYSTNPSFLDKDDKVRSVDFVYNPKTYITTVGLYNDNGDLLAVAKVPKPIEKDFNKEVLITVELQY